ncbi:MAG TPA: hypothetical protein VFV31_14960 [Chitinophagaceae bacterium]|nr:hypothetical protein [Chitinophagaceae bacterium]
MAKLKGVPAFTGSMGGLSAYTMRGVDRIIIREKGGPRRQQVKKGKQFAITRLRNEEWKGSMKGVQAVNLALQGVRHLADYNYTGGLSKICRLVQDDDTIHGSFGKRSVLFSRSGYKLEGFGLNIYHRLDSLLKAPLSCTLNRQTGTATVEWPDIIPAIHLANPMKQPYYRLVVAAASLADIVYDEARKMYRPAVEENRKSRIVTTAWRVSDEMTPAQEAELITENWQPQQPLSLVVAAGIEYGRPQSGGYIGFTKYAGAAKILKVG